MNWIKSLLLSKNPEQPRETDRAIKGAICFGNQPPDTLEDEWRGLWNFINIWINIDDPNADFKSTAGEIDLSDLNGNISPAIKQWKILCEYFFSIKKRSYLRDDPIIKRLPEVNATSVLIQGENDFWWVIKDEVLAKDNPPVHAIGWDYDKEEYYEVGEWAPSIAFFALSHLMSYGARYPYFVISIDKNDVLIEKLEESFENNFGFESMRIYEKAGAFILLGPGFNRSKWNVTVWLKSKSNYEELPSHLKTLSRTSQVTTTTIEEWRTS